MTETDTLLSARATARPSVVALTGMHRSGTSFAASLLQHAGNHLGEDLIAPNFDNTLGYFEDRTMVDFHKRAMARRGLDLICPSGTVRSFSEEERRDARDLVERGKAVLVFKDPRTTLFLHAWQEIVDLKVAFILRDPLETIDSLIRRNSDPSVRRNFMNAGKGTRIYLNAARRFHEARNALCRIYSIYDITASERAFLSSMADFTGLPISDEGYDDIYEPSLFKTGVNVSTKSRIAGLVYRWGLSRDYDYLMSHRTPLARS